MARLRPACALLLYLDRVLLLPEPAMRSSAGRFMRRLHAGAVNSTDLRAILDYAPGLEMYSDYRSVRQGALVESLLGALAVEGGLRKLCWTNYDDPALVGLGLGLRINVGVCPSVGVGLVQYAECLGMLPGSTLALPGLCTLKVELRHSSAHIEEHYLTAPPLLPGGGGGSGGMGMGLSLAEWCPHLEEFVPSANAA
ncbi:hypothetical protein B0H13DRAFT_2354406 [Mycena leptocephala]|nr:hypothetical protein B0H13DRAFT_2354406 [Mycena leptocephala]